MTDVWSERAELYRTSAAHSEGEDLDLLVEWARGASTALDVAAGGGHVARRLREVGVNVVTADPSPGMRADVLCSAESLPFAGSSFDVVVSRLGAHHFADVEQAVGEMARVAERHVLAVDNVWVDDAMHEAEVVRDPTHVRNYSAEEWRSLFERAGLVVEDLRVFDRAIELEPWLERAGCSETDAARVRELAAPRIDGGSLTLTRIAIKGRKA